ncbi:MFS general substrate transporter [Acaromyces ingoldii]|uniref:MFS general substrate transporter n=1 Tax=Acaromyces ingoldii TaxID=215250 RepID=A0A316YNZ9_9BASI|nr:MFS general substrate transporter [Acaromyces ingoldii]PWN91107.1 MFS general substrate transporter [Acaromyces ingoldii]
MPSDSTHIERPSLGDIPRSDDVEKSAASPSTSKGKEDRYVGWDGDDDRDNPLNFPKWKKYTILGIVNLSCLNVTCDSSVIASAYEGIQKDLHASPEVSILSLSLFVLGLALGPLLVAPMSEFYGRRPIYLISFLAFFLLGFPVAFANNLPVLFIFRFLTGFAGSAFLSVAGGTVSDLFKPKETFLPMAAFTCMTFLGPVLGPVYGGFIKQFSSQWRWTLWVQTIWSFLAIIAIFFFAPETYGPIVLVNRARRLRRESGGQHDYTTSHEEYMATQSVINTISVNMAKIPMLLALEPMLTILCLWCALHLGIIYLFFEFFPLVFGLHGFNDYQEGLSFLGLLVANAIGFCSMFFWRNRFLAAADPKTGMPPPEARLQPAMAGALLAPVGLFIFAFTAYENVHWIGPIIGSTIYGIGVLYVFFSVFSYTVANWRPVAASAMGANSMLRCCFAAGFPLFAVQMAHRLSNTGAVALLAGLNCLMVPVPFVLYKYGPKIRAKSRFTS